MTFRKGQSGNPGGRPKADLSVLEIARTASPRAMGRLVELIENADPRVAAMACNSVLDRAYGKPTQPIAGDDNMPPIQVETTQPPSVETLAKLSAQDRADIRTILGRALGRSEGDSESA